MSSSDPKLFEDFTCSTLELGIPAKGYSSVEGLVERAGAYFSCGKLALADFTCRSVLDASPGHPVALNLAGVIAARLGFYDQAIACFEQALAYHQSFQPAKHNLDKLRSMQPQGSRSSAIGRRRFLLVKAWGYGFWSDVNHLLGALLLAEITGRIPVTYWGTNSLFADGSNRDAFRLYFKPLSAFMVDDLMAFNNLDFFPPKWSNANLRAEDLAKWYGAGSRVAGICYLNRSETVAVSDFYIGVVDLLPWIPKNHRLHGKSIDEVYHYLAERYLKPRDSILSEVEAFYRQHIAGSPAIAVHVRGSDKKTEMEDLNRINRRYFEILDRENPSRPILLITDDMRWVAVFRAKYGNRLIVTNSQRTSTDVGIHYHSSVDRVRLGMEIMKDTYLALRCEKFVGNGQSNVSAMVALLKPWDPDDCVLLAPSLLHDRSDYLHRQES